MESPPFVGGQAVIAGVVVRTRGNWAIAVRLPDGVIDTVCGPNPRWPRRFDRIPLARGAVTTVFALGLFALVFAVLPAVAAGVVRPFVGDGVGFALVEGVTRLGLFLGYVVAIGRSAAIADTFAYHGAEHKVIAAFESGDFLLLVVLVAIVVFSLVPARSLAAVAATRVALLPVIARAAYEVLRLARHVPDSALVRAIVAPGLALQVLTTREPGHAHLEVATPALRTALDIDEPSTRPPP